MSSEIASSEIVWSGVMCSGTVLERFGARSDGVERYGVELDGLEPEVGELDGVEWCGAPG